MVFILDRALLVERRAKALMVVQVLDVAGDDVQRFDPALEEMKPQQPVFERGEEALGHHVVQAASAPTHALPHTRSNECVAVVSARVLASAVRVLDESRC